jgi:Zn-dependent protease
MGAIIVMDPSYANRREIFDIGIAGPLAGLVIAIPLAMVGYSFPMDRHCLNQIVCVSANRSSCTFWIRC